MALAGGSIRNLKRSIEKYINDNLYTKEGINIDFEGISFDDTSFSEWIMPRIIDIDNLFLRQGTKKQYAEVSNILYQFSIYIKKGSVTSADRMFIIRDLIAKYFKIGETINLNNYIDDDSNLNTIKIRKIVNDFELPETNELIMYNFSIEFDYTKLTNYTIKLITEDREYIYTEDGDYIILE